MFLKQIRSRGASKLACAQRISRKKNRQQHARARGCLIHMRQLWLAALLASGYTHPVKVDYMVRG